MKQLFSKNIGYKIVFYMVICVMIIGFMGNLFLFRYMNRIIIQKAEHISKLQSDALQEKIVTSFEELFNAAILTSNHADIVKAVRHKGVDVSQKAKTDSVRAQKVLNDSISTTRMNSYVDKLIVFHEEGLIIQAVWERDKGNVEDYNRIMESEIYKNREKYGGKPFFSLNNSIVLGNPLCFSALFPIDRFSLYDVKAYLYIELDTSIVTDNTAPQQVMGDLFMMSRDRTKRIDCTGGDEGVIEGALKAENASAQVFTHENQSYKLRITPIDSLEADFFTLTNISTLTIDDKNMKLVLKLILGVTAFVSIGALFLIRHYITIPVNRLIDRIKKISENDLSFDPEIERSKDEIGEIGRVVNEMTGSINSLMEERLRVNDEKNKIEMAMLQAQVNPHFLYNTLDSIHWMALIQKCPSISDITCSLSNLLRNMAKGVSDKISIEEELKLLQDYINIQSIRYVDTFEVINHISKEVYSYKIVKQTLQPLVENAIFHGLEPADRFGVITLFSRTDEEYLYLTVGDNGVGMSEEEVQKLKREEHIEHLGSIHGSIGYANVDKRIKLFYGKDCGLSIESKMNEYTKITVKIRKEQI